jgi:hypothetical protein
MDRKLGRMSFRWDLISQLTVLWHNKPIFEPQNSVLIDPEMLGFFFLHFPLYMVDTYIHLLQFDDSIAKTTLQSNLVEHNWVHKT